MKQECVTVEKQGFYKKIQFLDRSDDMSHPVRNIYKYTGSKVILGQITPYYIAFVCKKYPSLNLNVTIISDNCNLF